MDIVKELYNKIFDMNKPKSEINLKLIIYGPGLAGKTTNIEIIYNSINETQKSKLLRNHNKEGATLLYFEYLPICKKENSVIKITVMTNVGNVYSKLLVSEMLKNANAVLFVTDSQTARMDANLEYYWNLQFLLEENGVNFFDVQIVVQLNKRDLKEIDTTISMRNIFNNRTDIMFFETVAYKGINVLESFRETIKQMMEKAELHNHII